MYFSQLVKRQLVIGLFPSIRVQSKFVPSGRRAFLVCLRPLFPHPHVTRVLKQEGNISRTTQNTKIDTKLEAPQKPEGVKISSLWVFRNVTWGSSSPAIKRRALFASFARPATEFRDSKSLKGWTPRFAASRERSASSSLLTIFPRISLKFKNRKKGKLPALR